MNEQQRAAGMAELKRWVDIFYEGGVVPENADPNSRASIGYRFVGEFAKATTEHRGDMNQFFDSLKSDAHPDIAAFTGMYMQMIATVVNAAATMAVAPLTVADRDKNVPLMRRRITFFMEGLRWGHMKGLDAGLAVLGGVLQDVVTDAMKRGGQK